MLMMIMMVMTMRIHKCEKLQSNFKIQKTTSALAPPHTVNAKNGAAVGML